HYGRAQMVTALAQERVADRHLPRVVRPVAEAEHVRLRLEWALEPGTRADERREAPRGVRTGGPVAPEPRFAPHGEGEERLEAQPRLRALDGPMDEIEAERVLAVEEVARLLVEGRVEGALVPEQDRGAERRRAQHLVRVPHQGVGELHPL